MSNEHPNMSGSGNDAVEVECNCLVDGVCDPQCGVCEGNGFYFTEYPEPDYSEDDVL